MKPDEKIEVPKLSQDVKRMNGRSGYKLRRCIDALCEVLDEKDLPTKDDGSKDSVPNDN